MQQKNSAQSVCFKRLFFTGMFLLILIPFKQLSAKNIPVKKANYELAGRFSPKKLKKIVFSTSLKPHYLIQVNSLYKELIRVKLPTSG
jgi:hypothetical protein